MTKFQKIVFWRFLLTGTVGTCLGFYFLIYPTPHAYQAWIPIIVGNAGILFSFWYRYYVLKKQRRKTKIDI